MFKLKCYQFRCLLIDYLLLNFIVEYTGEFFDEIDDAFDARILL